MALIKGRKFHNRGDDNKNNNEPQEKVKKGGLIKGSKLRVNIDGDNSSLRPLKEVQRRKKKKILKSWTAILKEEEEEEIQEETEFIPTTFTEEPEDTKEDSEEKEEELPKEEEVQLAPEEEFKVEEPEPEPVPQIDVEAIIAEAEQKAQEQASKIIEHAQEEAKKLIDQAKIYGETAKQEAHQEGYKEGKDKGYKAGLDEFKIFMEQGKDLLNQLVNERDRTLLEVEPQLAKLSIAIAEKIIGEELKINKEVIVSVVKQAMSNLKSRKKVTIKVNPEDLEITEANRNLFCTLVEGMKELEIIGEHSIEKGGCVIETNLGNTDARVQTQIEAIKLAFSNIETGTFM